MKGERGIMGAQGRKEDKGEKGESVKGSPASGVPQTNWKQCVWKSSDSRDNGKIRVKKKMSNCNERAGIQSSSSYIYLPSDFRVAYAASISEHLPTHP